MVSTPVGRIDYIQGAGALRAIPGYETGAFSADQMPSFIYSDLLDLSTASGTHFLVPFKANIVKAMINIVAAAASNENGNAQFGTQSNNTVFGTFTINDTSSTGLQDVTGSLSDTTIDKGDIVRLGCDGGATTAKNFATMLIIAPRLT